MSAIEGFCEETFTAEDYTLPLFRKGEGPGVILLHELPGLTQETVEFAEWIAERGFHVVMPLLFGNPLQSVAVGLLKAPFACIRREFNNLAAGRSSAITLPLRRQRVIACCRRSVSSNGSSDTSSRNAMSAMDDVGISPVGRFFFLIRAI